MRKVTLLVALLSALLWIGPLAARAQESLPPPPSPDAPAEVAPAIENGRAASGERSSYRWFQGRWWYLLPDGRWMYWSRDHWVDYVPPPPSQTTSPRVVTRYPATTYSYSSSSYGYPVSTYYYPSSGYYGSYGGGYYPSVGVYFGGHGHGGHFYGGHGHHYGGHGGHGGHGGPGHHGGHH